MIESYPIPFVMVRVGNLPKNAPLEVEMVSIPDKLSLEQDFTGSSLTLMKDGDIRYLFKKYTSLEELLLSDQDLFGAQQAKEGRQAFLRVDVYCPSNLQGG